MRSRPKQADYLTFLDFEILRFSEIDFRASKCINFVKDTGIS